MLDFKNTLTNHDAMICLGAFIEFLDKYESVLLEVDAGNLSDDIVKKAQTALKFGNELIDGPLN